MKKLDELFESIRNDCLKLIDNKKVDLDILSFMIGCSQEELTKILLNKNEDFSVYLKLYDVLVEW